MLVTGSGIKPRHHLPLVNPLGRQRVPLKTQQTHTPGLLTSQDRLDDGEFSSIRHSSALTVEWCSAFALGNLTAAADHPVVKRLLPVESSR